MGASVQATASCLVLGLFIALHARTNPFQSGSLDLAELISLVVSQATMLCGLLLNTDAVTDSAAISSLIAIAIIVGNALCILLFAKALWRAAHKDGILSSAGSAARSAISAVHTRSKEHSQSNKRPSLKLGSRSATVSNQRSDSDRLRRRSQRALALATKIDDRTGKNAQHGH